MHVEVDFKSRPVANEQTTGELERAGPVLSIGEVARHAGVRTSAIRYYESIGLLPAPERERGRRRYRPETLRLLAVIDAAQRAGLSLAEIGELLSASRDGRPVGPHLRRLAERKLPEIDALIEHAHAVRRWLEAALTCECLTLDDCPLLQDGSCGEAASEAGSFRTVADFGADTAV